MTLVYLAALALCVLLVVVVAALLNIASLAHVDSHDAV
jgi:hypothetical protein